MTLLRKILEIAVSERDKDIAWLLLGALFFAIRSSEYLKVDLEEIKRKIII